MEIVLLWIDDLDDVVFTLALAWERARRSCLGFGLAAALALAAVELSSTNAGLWPLLAGTAGASVASWLVGGAFLAIYRKYRPVPVAAP